MKKVLVITYYWPPSGGPGVQRWLRFVKHLREFGWEPVMYVPKDAPYVTLDENLIHEIPEGVQVLSHPIIEPNAVIEKLTFSSQGKDKLYDNQQQKGQNKTLFQRLLWYVRGNYFVPDARMFWIRPSLKFLRKTLKKQKFDAIISSGPPHSVHLIAEGLKKEFGIPWLADFRDPWTSMDYLKEMDLSTSALQKHWNMEKSVLQSADRVVVVGKTMQQEFQENHQVNSVIIHNGFNEMTDVEAVELDKKFTISHIGSFLKNRNCDDLWSVLAEMVEANAEFATDLQIRLVGKLAPNVTESLTRFELTDHCELLGYVPFSETQQYLHSTQVLLLPIDRIENAEFVLTGKIFEYLKAKRPILLIGPKHGDAAALIDETKAGYCCNFDDRESIKQIVGELYHKFKKGENELNSSGIEQFSGIELTRKLAATLTEITSAKTV